MPHQRRFQLALPLALAFVACVRGGIATVRPATTSSAVQAPPPNTGDLPFGTAAQAESLLVDVRAAEPTILVEMRYATTNNFTGAVLPGYEANRAFLRREAAAALARAQRRFAAGGVGLKVFDGYRPVRATLAMVDWTNRVGREDLIRDEYIASRSRHNLGLAIDLTLVDRATGRELDMGTPFDEFSERAHTANATGDVNTNRQRLKRVMEAEGFANYAKEWWHYSFDVPTPLGSMSSFAEARRLARQADSMEIDMRSLIRSALAGSLMLGTAACVSRQVPADEHGGHDASSPATSMSSASPVASQGPSLPAGAADVDARLAASPHRSEWKTIAVSNGPGAATANDSVRVFVVYPERRTKAPVVIVIHEIFGLSPWVRGVADQLAADGFIAIAPDLMTMQKIPGSPLNPNADSARAAIRGLDTAYVHRQIDVVAKYGMGLPTATQKYGIVGYCWGGSTSFAHAVHSPTLGAAVVYYGGSPPAAQLSKVKAPVIGFYGENDARVNSTIPPADTAMRALGKTYEYHILPGAGHGFLRQQDGQNGANLAATQKAWPMTVAWFRKYL